MLNAMNQVRPVSRASNVNGTDSRKINIATWVKYQSNEVPALGIQEKRLESGVLLGGGDEVFSLNRNN